MTERPAKPKKSSGNYRLTPEAIDAVRAKADAEGLRPCHVVERLVRDHLIGRCDQRPTK